MATSSQTLNDQANGTRLSRLLVDKGTQALRKALQLHLTLLPSTLSAALNTHKTTLQKLRYKVISPSQWALLYPTSGLPDLQNFDVTLLTVLLRNICGLTSPATGWDALPPDSDTSIADNIARVKYYRNKVYAHVATTEIADKEFENLWQKISTALIGLGIPKSELDELKEAPLTPNEDVYVEQLKEWRKKDDELTEICLETNAEVKKLEATVAKLQQELKQKYPGSENVSNVDKLCKCDFTSTIKQLNNKFLPGTRQWLFDELSSWFTNKHSDSTVMIVTGGPGVGKSVFSAEVCRMYTELKQLAACHFCLYNKSDYRNPLKIIESLASHMCLNVRGFREKLQNQLKRNHSRETTTDAFRVLINDPLYALEEREPMLLVIDALDESEFGGKSEFLELMSDEFPNLPKWIKILITSRPELPVQEKLEHLNPVHIAPHKAKNVDDIQKYLRNSLSSTCDDDAVFQSLAWKCQGSFLYAYYTQVECKKKKIQLTKENLSELVPKGIGDFYQKQFKHLKNQLNELSSSEVTFKRFLEVLVVARGRLPLSLLPECLGLPNDAEYELREKINEIMSSILPVYDDCLTIYHKSLRDWLTSDGYKEHAFTVDSQSGHEYLWSVCEKVFNQINSATTLPSLKSPLTRYALTHGIFHMIKCGGTCYHWLVNIKIVHYQLMSDPHRVFKMKTEWQEIVKNSLSSLCSELLLELNWHIRIFDRFVLPFVNSAFYLQSVANRIDCDCTDDKRSLARSLLKLGHHIWLEDLDATNLKQPCHKSVPLRTDVTCIGVSSNQQLVAIGYKDGWISIFTVPEFQEIQKFNTMGEYVCLSDDVFSQEKCMLLYDDYDRFLVRRESQDLPFFGGDHGALWSCSFSLSGNRLVTCDGSEKIKLWDVNDGTLLAELQAGGPVDSCSFSECGLFIVASKERKNDKSTNQSDVFTVWNVFTQQRVDRRSIKYSVINMDGFKMCKILQSIYRLDMMRSLPNGGRKTQISMSRNGEYIDVFQLPDVLLVAKLYAHVFLFLTPVTRDHWRNCVLHHTNESMQFTNVFQLGTMIAKGRCGREIVRGGPSIFFIGCFCNFLKATRVAPIKVQELYVVPFFNKLNIFNIVDQHSLSIQSLPFPETYVISCCCFSPDGFFLATCANHDPLSIVIWNAKLCTVVQVWRVPLNNCAEGCWWSESLLWIYDGGLVKIPISNEETLELTGTQRVQITWKATKMLTFSDVLIFVDQNNSANVARIKAGELQYVEKLPVDRAMIQCAAVSPCNSIILTASSTTFYVFKEDQSPQPLHWMPSNTGTLSDVLNESEHDSGNNPLLVPENAGCKCAITTDGKRGVLALSFHSKGYLILVDLNSQKTTWIRSSVEIATMDSFFVGNSYCIGVNILGGDLIVEELSDGKVASEWRKCFNLDFSPVVALSKNNLVAVISANGTRVQFFKIVVPD